MHTKWHKIDSLFISNSGNRAFLYFFSLSRVKLEYFVLPQQLNNSASKSLKSKQENAQEARHPRAMLRVPSAPSVHRSRMIPSTTLIKIVTVHMT